MKRWQADLLLLLAAAVWGFAFVAQRVGMEHVGPFTFNAVRFAIGAAVLAPWALRRRPRGGAPNGAAPGAEGGASGEAAASGGSTNGGGAVAAPPPASRSLVAPTLMAGGTLAGVLLFLGASFQQVGIVSTLAGKAGFITGLYVVLVPLLGLFWRQRVAGATWLGALLAAAGLYLLSVTGRLTFAPGDLLVLASAVFWALHVLAIGWLSGHLAALRLACWQYLVCSLLSAAVAVAGESLTAGALRAALPAILYAGVLSTGLAYTLQVVAQRVARPAPAAIILSLEAVFAALGGGLLLGETLSPRALGGCALMLAGMLLSQFPGPKKTRAAS